MTDYGTANLLKIEGQPGPQYYDPDADIMRRLEGGPGGQKVQLSGSIAKTGGTYAPVFDLVVDWTITDYQRAWSVYAKNGLIYVGWDDGDVVKYKPDGTVEWTFTGHTDRVVGLFVDGDGNVYTASADRSIRKINSAGAEVWTTGTLGGSSQGWLSVYKEGNHVYGGHSTVTGGADLCKLDDTDGSTVWIHDDWDTILYDVVVDGDDIYIAGTVNAYKLDQSSADASTAPTTVWTYTGHSGSVLNVKLGSGTYLYTSSGDNTVKKIDQNGQSGSWSGQEWTFNGHTNNVWGLWIDKDEFIYTTSSDMTSRKLNSVDGSEIYNFNGHDDRIYQIAVMGGYVYTASWDTSFKKFANELQLTGYREA